MSHKPQSITKRLSDYSQGDSSALAGIWPEVQEELHRIAKRYLVKERQNHTLQPTALVNEAFLKFANGEKVAFADRSHFFAIASNAMRRILIDYAKARKAEKRGGGGLQVTFDEKKFKVEENSVDLLRLDEALTKLGLEDSRLSQIVEMRYFGGLSIEETAQVLKISPATVKRDWQVAKIWLMKELEG